MLTKIIEATNEEKNWGKFLVGWFGSQEVDVLSAIDNNSVVGTRWTRRHVLVIDIQTGEGAIFLLGGHAKSDLNKHAIWVCPLFEPFLEWLYKQEIKNFADLEKLPALVQLPEAEFQMRGYRRNPDLADIQTHAHGMGQEEVLERLSRWAVLSRRKTAPFATDPSHLLDLLHTGEWAKDLLAMEAFEKAGPVAVCPSCGSAQSTISLCSNGFHFEANGT